MTNMVNFWERRWKFCISPTLKHFDVHSDNVSEKQDKNINHSEKLDESIPSWLLKQDIVQSRNKTSSGVLKNYAEFFNDPEWDGKISTAFLQRKTNTGYIQAASIIEFLEKNRLLSQASHVGKRKWLIHYRFINFKQVLNAYQDCQNSLITDSTSDPQKELLTNEIPADFKISYKFDQT